MWWGLATMLCGCPGMFACLYLWFCLWGSGEPRPGWSGVLDVDCGCGGRVRAWCTARTERDCSSRAMPGVQWVLCYVRVCVCVRVYIRVCVCVRVRVRVSVRVFECGACVCTHTTRYNCQRTIPCRWVLRLTKRGESMSVPGPVDLHVTSVHVCICICV
jgi:hypothetical protein